MFNLESIFSDRSKLHHAYILHGDLELSKQALVDKLRSFLPGEYLDRPHPDFWQKSYQMFSIDESRDIKEFQARRPLGGYGKYFILNIGAITEEAQQALLKTLEEPVSETYFFLITERIEQFLPTVLSRCIVVSTEGRAEDGLSQKVKDFLMSDLGVRQDMVKKLLAEHEAGNKNNIRSFLSCLLEVYRQSIDLAKADEKTLRSLKELEKSANLAGTRGSSVKLILEYVVGVLPAGIK